MQVSGDRRDWCWRKAYRAQAVEAALAGTNLDDTQSQRQSHTFAMASIRIDLMLRVIPVSPRAGAHAQAIQAAKASK